MINYFLDIFSISAVLMLIYFIFLRGETHHRRNRFYLLASLIASIVIPSISWESIKNWIFPTETAQVDNLAPIDDFRFAINDLRNNAVETFTWQEAFGWIYGLGVAFLLLRFIFRLTIVVKMIYKNQKSKQKDYTLVLCEAGTPPASFLHFLFWDKNQTLENSDGQKIFVHERTHIRERHTYDMLLTELALIFFWIVPTFYLLKKELEENHEFTADEAVTQNFNPHEYEQLLITSVFKNLDLQLTSSFYQLSIKNRIKMMNKSKTSAWALAKIAVLVPLMIFLVIACAKQEISKMNDEGFRVCLETNFTESGSKLN